MASIIRLVPLSDLNLRARVNTSGKIVGFVDNAGNAVSLSNTAPFNTVTPSITGSPNVASTLTAVDGTWSGEDNVMTYQWNRDGVAIGGATASTRVLASADLGHTLTVSVTGTNGAGTETDVSAGVVILDTVPVNTVAPLISGTGVVGAALTVTNGTTSGVANTYTYQWKKDAVAINGATTNSYTPIIGDVDGVVTCAVTATNTGGAVTTGSSNSKTITAS